MKRMFNNPAMTTKQIEKLISMTERELLTNLKPQERRELQEILQVLREASTNEMATGFTLTPAIW